MHFNFKAEAEVIFVTFALVIVLFIAVPPLLTRLHSKDRVRVTTDLRNIAQLAIVYEQEEGAFPDSLEQLDRFLKGSFEVEFPTLPRIDPWKHEYEYFRVSENRAGIISKGRNDSLDTTLDFLSTTSVERPLASREDKRYWLTKRKDDWICILDF